MIKIIEKTKVLSLKRIVFAFFSTISSMKNSVGKGAIILVLSGVICKIFGAMFRLPLTNIIGIKGIGIFQMVMSIYSLLLVLITGGVTTSLSHLVSLSRARGDYEKVGGYLRSALLVTFSVGVVLGILFLLISKSLASAQGAIEGYQSYNLLIFLLPLGAIIGVLRGIIQGFENMTPTAISQIIEQIIKFAFGLLFAYLLGKRGLSYGVYGAFLGITISELLACLYLVFFSLTHIHYSFHYQRDTMRDFLRASLPLSLSGAVIPFTHAIDASIIVPRLMLSGLSNETATALYGLSTGVVGAILNFPLIISLSIAMALLPKISFLLNTDDFSQQRQVISNSFSIMWFFLLPLVVGIMSISKIIYPLIYPQAIKNYLDIAVELTIIGGVGIILTGVMQFLLTLLQAGGNYLFTLLSTLLGGIAKIILVIFLASSKLGIFAIPISNIALAVVVCIMALLKLGRVVKISAYYIIVPILASIIMFASVYVFLLFTHFNAILSLVFAVFLGSIIYLTLNLPILSGIIKKIFGKNLFKKGDMNE